MPHTASMSSLEEQGERITRLETTVGQDEKSGIRGDITKLNDNQDKIFDRLREMEKRAYMIIGGAAVLLWIIEHVTK